MVALLDDAPRLKHEYVVSHSHRRETMTDQERGLPGRQLIEAAVDLVSRGTRWPLTGRCCGCGDLDMDRSLCLRRSF